MNIKVRLKNPVFIFQMILAVGTPVLAYSGLTAADMTTWAAVGNTIVAAVANPYVLSLVAVSVWNALNDPTTAGVKDSAQAMTYEEPKKDGE